MPPPVEVQVRTHAEACGATRTLPSVRVGASGEVANAVVQIEGVTRGPVAPLADLELVFRRCDLSSSVAVAMAGGSLRVRNEDPILHNLHITLGGQTRLDVGLAAAHGDVSLPLVAGLHRVVDDAAHPWIDASIVVTRHPYVVVTGEDGRFTLPRVPVGAYRLRVWHRGIAESGTSSGRPLRTEPIVLVRPVAVEEARDTVVDFTLDLGSGHAAGAEGG